MDIAHPDRILRNPAVKGTSMKNCIITVLVTALVIIMSAAFLSAADDSPEVRGKALFSTDNFADGKRSCDSCHLEGRGLEGASEKESFTIGGTTVGSLEEAVNICIEGANKGKPIPVDSREMKDIVSYIRSLGKPVESGLRG
jgi:mono/diheme cytochrome c family protein